MITHNFSKDFHMISTTDENLRVFDIIMHTEFGTTYNSYLLSGSEKTALFESTKFTFWEEYKPTLEALTDIGRIDYIIVDHTEPDHSGSIAALLSLNPNIQIVGTAGAINFLKEIVNMPFNSIVAKNNDTLSLGNKTLKFIVVPNLHWPDTMYTYIVEEKALITCDSFGSHYGVEGVLQSEVTHFTDYMAATKYYFDNIIGPFKNPFMVNAINIVKDMDIELLCPGHGPVIDKDIKAFIELYHGFCEVPKKGEKPLVVIPYVSAYGYTKLLAEAIAKGIRSVNATASLFDMVTADMGTVMAEIGKCDGLLLGSPTILGDALKPIYDITTSMFPPIHKGLLASAFGSYGWSGEAVQNLMSRLTCLKLNVVEGFKVRFKPTDDDLANAFAFGVAFASKLQ